MLLPRVKNEIISQSRLDEFIGVLKKRQQKVQPLKKGCCLTLSRRENKIPKKNIQLKKRRQQAKNSIRIETERNQILLQTRSEKESNN